MSEPALVEELTRPPRRFRSYSDYKDARALWLRQVPFGWSEKPLKALLSRNESGAWGDDSLHDGMMVLRSTDQTVDGKWKIEAPAERELTARDAIRTRLRVGDLVVTKSSGSHLHIGKTSIVDEAVASLAPGFSNFMQRLILNEHHEPRYYWYLMNSPIAREQFVFMSSTTTGLGNLNGSILGAIWVPVPAQGEQRAIAAFLDRETARIEALVAKKERLIKLLQEKRRALVTRAVTTGLDSNVPMKDSAVEWLGEIPTHWQVKKLAWVTTCLDGRRVPLNAEERGKMQGDYPYWGANSIVDYVDSWLFDEELVLLGEDGAPFFDLARPVAFRVSDKIWVNNHAHVLRPRRGLDAAFLAQALNCLDYRAFIDGTTRDKLTQGDMNSIPVQYPPLPEQRAIASFVRSRTRELDGLLTKIRMAISHLLELRTALISAAVTGKIDVREEAP